MTATCGWVSYKSSVNYLINSLRLEVGRLVTSICFAMRMIPFPLSFVLIPILFVPLIHSHLVPLHGMMPIHCIELGAILCPIIIAFCVCVCVCVCRHVMQDIYRWWRIRPLMCLVCHHLYYHHCMQKVTTGVISLCLNRCIKNSTVWLK